MGQKRGKCCPYAPRLPVCNASPRADLQVGQLFPSPDYMGRPGGFARFIMCFPCSLMMRPSSEKIKNHQWQNKCLYLGAKILMHIEIQSETHDAQSGHWHPFKLCKTGEIYTTQAKQHFTKVETGGLSCDQHQVLLHSCNVPSTAPSTKAWANALAPTAPVCTDSKAPQGRSVR